MSETRSDVLTDFDDDSLLSEAILAELERKAEKGLGSKYTERDSVIGAEHQRCLSFVERLTAPLRATVVDEFPPPSIAEYGPLEEIGRGGMGIVYRARHHKTQRIDAIKIVRPDRLISSRSAEAHQLRQRFERETRLASRVSHEHIVPVYQAGEDEQFLWFSMQYVQGPSLHDLVEENALPLETGVSMIEKVTRAVAVVHRHGVLHGDIKPRNILIENGSGRPMITDFGLADLHQSVSADFEGVAGTLAYMAPELILASQSMRTPEEVANVRSVAADIYSLGATLAAVIRSCSHRNPRQDGIGEKSKRVVPGQSRTTVKRGRVPAELARICRRCMAAEPTSRYATADELASELAFWLERPTWNRHFPSLGRMLWMVAAPGLAASGFGVWGLSQIDSPEILVWIAIFIAYVPLFAVFYLAQTYGGESHRARRELWSIWLGHFVGALVCMIALRIRNAEMQDVLSQFYPCVAAISSVVFFSKSGNFSNLYIPIGALWALSAIGLSFVPNHGSIYFGALAAITCMLVFIGDRAFHHH